VNHPQRASAARTRELQAGGAETLGDVARLVDADEEERHALGAGTLTYNSANNTLQWTSFGGSIGEAVTVTNDGKYQVFDADKNKWVRVIVETASLPGSNQTDTITVSPLDGKNYARALARRLLTRFRDPASTVAFEIDLNDFSNDGEFLKPTDLVDLTTDEAFTKGKTAFVAERMMITSFRPDFTSHRARVETIQTRLYLRYGFVAPAGYPDYPSATAAQRERAFIGGGSNKVNGGTEDGYYIR